MRSTPAMGPICKNSCNGLSQKAAVAKVAGVRTNGSLVENVLHMLITRYFLARHIDLLRQKSAHTKTFSKNDRV